MHDKTFHFHHLSPRERADRVHYAQTALLGVFALCFAAVLWWMLSFSAYTERVVAWYDQRTQPVVAAPVAAYQVYFLQYEKFVLDQQRAGMEIWRIRALVAIAGHGGDKHGAHGLTLDDPDSCGSIETILDAANANQQPR